MRAVVFDAPGLENLRLAEVERPAPGPGEALVRVRYVGVNPIDLAVVSGAVKASPMPHVPGCEFVGTVEAAGEGSHVGPGDNVVVYSRLFCGRCRQCLSGETQICEVRGQLIGAATNGGMAEYAVVPTANLVRTGAPLERAVGLPIGGLTAWNMLRRASVSAGDLVVVMGATGNVGVFAVQLAKLMGAYVMAVTRRGKQVEAALRGLGADAVATPEEARDLVARQGGADVVVDPLGAGTWELSYSMLGRGGRYVTAGVLTGQEVRLDLRRLYGVQGSILGSTGGRLRDLQTLVGLLESGRVTTPIHARYPLGRAREAFEALRSPDRVGKVVVEV